MATTPQQPKERDGVITTLNVFIEAFTLAKEIASITPAKAVFGSAAVILTTIKEYLSNQQDYIELGQNCVKICCVLDRGTQGKGAEHLSQLVRDAINRLETTVAEIEKKVKEESKRNAALRLLHAKNDKEKIAGWSSDLNKILQIFNTELAIDTNVAVSSVYNLVSGIHKIVSGLFLNEDEFDEAHSHIDQAKSHAADDPLNLGCAMEWKAEIFYQQRHLEDALSEALGALGIYEKLGASTDIVDCKRILKKIEQAIAERDAPSSGPTTTSPGH